MLNWHAKPPQSPFCVAGMSGFCPPATDSPSPSPIPIPIPYSHFPSPFPISISYLHPSSPSPILPSPVFLTLFAVSVPVISPSTPHFSITVPVPGLGLRVEVFIGAGRCFFGAGGHLFWSRMVCFWSRCIFCGGTCAVRRPRMRICGAGWQSFFTPAPK